MSDKISSEAKNIFNRSVKIFANLLKEFPKNAADDFIYDDSTLKKIGDALKALKDMKTFFSKKGSSLGDEENTVKDSLKIFSLLMDELPKDPSDEFMYDRVIHHMVEDTRGAISKITQLFS